MVFCVAVDISRGSICGVAKAQTKACSEMAGIHWLSRGGVNRAFIFTRQLENVSETLNNCSDSFPFMASFCIRLGTKYVF